MRFFKRILKVLAWFFGFLLLVLICFCIYVWYVSDIKPPKVEDQSALLLHRKQLDSTTFTIGQNWIRKNKYGLYEMYVSGPPFQRGVINGKLSQELIAKQEIAFVNQIKKMIPSNTYLKFLKYVIGFMNRDLASHVTEEDKEEIYGVSFAAPDSFQWIGTNYSRMLDYHAAHDIGHALQNLMLVGCTSFGAWNQKTEHGALIIGRNFDFWVGDEFAINKIVEFVHPEKGYDFAFVTWGGFIGVVSGMNKQGLTVTINAAKSRIPTDAATPVSLVAREILQYASNIKEAIAIAHKRQMFVSESFLIGSAKDNKSIIIEKTPDTLAIYDPSSNHIECTNHYQSNYLGKQQLNQERMADGASVYRFKRLQQLLNENYPLTPEKVAKILRNTKGMDGQDIGLGNEKAVNQFIAHHSVIFMPDSLRMWISSNPWQMGEYVCYDLRKVFNRNGLKSDYTIADTAYNIAPDPFLKTVAFAKYMQFREMSTLINDSKITLNIPEFISDNPEFFETYKLAGQYYRIRDLPLKAIPYYEQALTKVIPTLAQRQEIEQRLKEVKDLIAEKKIEN